MFDIEYKGGNAVIISSKKVTIAVDPCISILGLKDAKLKDAVELLTEERFRVSDADLLLTIDGPGEYEVADFTIRGIAAARLIDDDQQVMVSTIYRIEQSDVSIAVIGNVARKLSEEQLEMLGLIDILVIPVGGGDTLDATSAAALVRDIEPKIVVPIHFADAGLRYELPQEAVETFTKELGAPVEEVVKFKLKSAAALPATLTVNILPRA